MQALHLLALEPVSETLADPNSYGFRPYRCTADAIKQSKGGGRVWEKLISFFHKNNPPLFSKTQKNRGGFWERW